MVYGVNHKQLPRLPSSDAALAAAAVEEAVQAAGKEEGSAAADGAATALSAIFSAASCTTNAIVPVLKAMNDTFGIKVLCSAVICSALAVRNLIRRVRVKMGLSRIDSCG